jgi:serine/threonine protein kinase
VAVKVVLPHLLALTSVRERFLREARLGLAVTHENVVRTLDLETVTHEGVELHCLVLELVKGRTLRRLLESLGTVPEALLRELGAQAARGLAALHRAGIVHRDVKPENLVLTDDRRLLVMDLGVAKVLGGAALVERGTLTTAGQFVGSLHYAAPEQCEGTEVGPAADLYALGAALRARDGRPPFETEGTVALMRAHLSTTPVPAAERNPAVSDLLSDAIEVLLAKRPADRFPSAQALAEALVEGEGGAWWATHRRRVTERRPRRVEGTSEVPLVGRKAERARLAQAWAEAVGGGHGVAAGEPGIGKSRLADELTHGGVRGAVVLRSGFHGDDGGMRRLPRLGTEASAARSRACSR